MVACRYFAKNRFSQDTIDKSSAIFCWGTEDEKTLKDLYKKDSKKIFKTGSPRVDLWRSQFSKNWFLSNLNIFKKYLKTSPNNILEIGTYEGLVAIWFSKNFPKSKVYAVDPLIQDLNTLKERVESEQINNLNINLDIIKSENIIFEKKTSDSFFLNNKLLFDIVYIDGLHTYEACTKDLLNSFKFLNVEGYMMIDDVRLDVYPNKLNVINAIKNFLDCYSNYIDIIFFGWNVIVIKKKREIDF